MKELWGAGLARSRPALAGVAVACVALAVLASVAPFTVATSPTSAPSGSVTVPAVSPSTTPYVAHTLNLLNGSLLAQNVPAPGCSLPTPAPYIVHFPQGPTAAVDLPVLHELFVTCPTGNLLILNDTTAELLATVGVGALPTAVAAQEMGGGSLVYVANSRSDNVSVISPVTDRVVSTLVLPIGSAPAGLAFGPGGTGLYVTESGLGSVAVLDPATGALVRSISVGSEPLGISLDPFNGLLYVANSMSDNVSVISPVSHSVIASTPVGSVPVGITTSGTDGTIYVSNSDSGSVSVLSPANQSVIATVSVGAQPLGLAYSPSDRAVYVADNGSNAVSVIDVATDQMVATVPVGLRPQTMAVGQGVVYSVNSESYNLSRISTGSRTVVGTLVIAVSPRGMAYDPTTQLLYVPLGGNDSIAVINTTTNRMVGTLRTGLEPSLATYDPFNGKIYVDNHEEDTIAVINGTSNTVETTFPVGDGPTSMVVDPVSHDLFVGIGHVFSVEVINTETNTITKTIPVGNTPYGMAYIPVDGGRIFVTNYRSGNLSVIDPATESVVGNYPIAPGPTLMGYDAANGIVYISSFVANRLYEFNASTDTVVGSIPVGTSPMGVQTAGFGGLIYVANYGSNNLTAIDPATGRTTASIPVATEPIAPALLPNGEMFATNAGASALSILSNNTFTAVTISTSSTRVATGASTQVTAQPTCSLGPCPSSILYRWSLTSQDSTVNSTAGATITFYGGDVAETATLSLNATLGPVSLASSIALTVGSGSPAPTLWGLPLNAAYAVLGSIAIAVVAIVAAGIYAYTRSQPPPKNGTIK